MNGAVEILAMKTVPVSFAILTLVLGVAPAIGQYAPGDFIVTSHAGGQFPSYLSNIYGVPPHGKVYTLTRISMRPWSIAPAPDNRSLWVSGQHAGGRTWLARIRPNGTVTTISPMPMFGCIEVSDTGAAILGARSGWIYRYAGNTMSTLFQGPLMTDILAGGIDLASGNLVVVVRVWPYQVMLFRVMLGGQVRVASIMTALPPIPLGSNAGLHHDPDTNTLVGSWGSGVYQLAIASPTGFTTLLSGSPFGTLGKLDRDSRDGQFVIPSIGSSGSTLFRFDTRTASITSMIRLPGAFAATVAGSRHLSAQNAPRPGHPWNLLVSSPNEPGAYYIVALSFSFQSGIPVGRGRKIHLAPDGLFWFSLSSSTIFSGFQGQLGPTGEAIATVSMPNLPSLKGHRFFAACVTIVQKRVSVISETLGATIR